MCMARLEFIVTISRCCAREGKSLYDIGRRYGWSEEDIGMILLGKKDPTASQLRQLDKEFGMGSNFLKTCLKR